MTSAQRERKRIVRYIVREAYSMNKCGDRLSVKIGECFFLLAQKVKALSGGKGKP
jgi:hypothetical protein